VAEHPWQLAMVVEAVVDEFGSDVPDGQSAAPSSGRNVGCCAS
jgi:hypothetical protein